MSEHWIESETEMLEYARAFAARLEPGDVVAIDGPLGAGKTVFCRGILGALGYEGEVSSPTFTIANHYAPPQVTTPVIHADLYRIEHPDELDEIGLFEGDLDDSIVLVEWAERAGPALRNPACRIEIEPASGNRRRLSITGGKTA